MVFVFAAADEQPASLDGDLCGEQRIRMLRGMSTVHLQRLSFEGRERSGPRLKSTQTIEQVIRAAGEVHASIFFF